MANRPADRVAERKVNAASPADLLAVGLARDAEASELILPECRKLLAKYGSIHRLADITAADLRAAAGQEGYEIERTMALLELGRRIAVADRGEAMFTALSPTSVIYRKKKSNTLSSCFSIRSSTSSAVTPSISAPLTRRW